MTAVAMIATSDLSQRLDVSEHLIMFDGVSRHLAGGEWTAQVNPSIWATLQQVWPGQDEAPLLFGVRAAGSAAGWLLVGPIRSATLETDAAGVPSLALQGVDDWAHVLGGRLVTPQPFDLPPWSTSSHHTVAGRASTAVATLINDHAGATARLVRQVPGLRVLDRLAGVDGTWTYRLADLGSAVADIARAAGLRAVMRRDMGGALTADIGAATVRDSVVVDETRLSKWAVSIQTHEASTVVAGGAGEGTARLFHIAGDDIAGHARIETFSDQRNIGTAPTLAASAAATRAALSASTSLEGELLPSAIAGIDWRTDYDLGDRVTLQVQGTRWPAVVEAVRVTVAADGGLLVTPQLGKPTRSALTRLIRDVANVADRLSGLEVN